MNEYTLPEQRHRQRIARGNMGVIHIQWASTYRSWLDDTPDLWTRKACDSRNLCGSMPRAVIGVDAADWPTERQPVDNASDVTCERCRVRYATWLRRREARMAAD